MSTQLPESPPSRSERTWAMFTHLSALTQFIGIPFGTILGPLIIWVIKKEQSSFVDEHGKASLNFQISMLIYAALAVIFVVFLAIVANAGSSGFVFAEGYLFRIPLFMLAGAFLFVAIIVTDVVLTIIAAVNASDGKSYRYPLAIRFIK